MANHYIRQGATGSNNGSDWNSAWTQFPATLFRGDTYYIAGGNYGWLTADTPENGTLVITIKKATVSEHGTNTGWQSSYGTEQAVFTSLVNFRTGYWIFDGVTGSGNDVSSYGFVSPVWGGTADEVHIHINSDNERTFKGIEIRHVAITCSGSRTHSEFGIAGGPQANVINPLIQHCYIDNCQVNLYTHGSGWLVENNYFDRSWSVHPGYHGVPIQDSYAYGTIFRNNIIMDCTYICIEQGNEWFPSRAQIYNNIFDPHFNVTQGIVSGSSGYPVTDDLIYNNTIINSISPILYDNGGTGNEVKNNLFFNSHGYAAGADTGYNSYFGTSWDYDDSQPGIQVSSDDPFVNSAIGDYRLKAATALGITLPSPYNVDFLGNIRGADGVWDRGAYEYVSNQECPTPIVTFNINI